MKKFRKFGMLCAALVLGVSLMLATGISNVPAEAASTALYVQSSRYYKENGGKDYRVTYEFDKSVGNTGEVLDNMSSKLEINGVNLGVIDDVVITVDSSDDKVVNFVFPVSAEVNGELILTEVVGENNTIVLLSGFGGSSGNRTTVKVFYYYQDGARSGTRVYRSNDLDDYQGVSVTSISVPEIQGGNFCFYIYFSDVLCSRKLTNLQTRNLVWMKAAYGTSGNKNYTNEEIDLYDRFEIIGKDNEQSLIYKMWFGCDSYQSMYTYEGELQTPQGSAGDISLYTLSQIQEQTLDSSQKFNATDASWQELVVQVHLEDNHIQFILKGDSTRDESFKDNIAPETNENMAICLKAGMMFPNGTVLKEDFTYVYDPSSKLWSTVGGEAADSMEDTTLSNQEGYTAEELGNGGSVSSGCKSQLGVKVSVTAATVLAGLSALLIVKRRGERN